MAKYKKTHIGGVEGYVADKYRIGQVWEMETTSQLKGID